MPSGRPLVICLVLLSRFVCWSSAEQSCFALCSAPMARALRGLVCRPAAARAPRSAPQRQPWGQRVFFYEGRTGETGRRLTTSLPATATADAQTRNADEEAVAVIVGGTRGIGLAIARRLLVRFKGYIFVTGRTPGEAHELQQLMDLHPARITPLAVEVTDEASVAAAAAHIRALTGARVDLVVNTAGILHDVNEPASRGRMPERQLKDVSEEWLMHNFRVNTMGPLFVAKHLQDMLETKGPAAKKSKRAAAVFATLSARVGSIEDNRLGGWYSYRISKAAQNQLTRTAALELKRRGCIACALHPGTVKTGLSGPFQSNVKPEKLLSATQAADMLLDVIDSLEESDAGSFFDYARQPIPW